MRVKRCQFSCGWKFIFQISTDIDHESVIRSISGVTAMFFSIRCWSFPISADFKQSKAYRQELWLLISPSLVGDGSTYKLRAEMALTKKGYCFKSRRPKRDDTILYFISHADFDSSIPFQNTRRLHGHFQRTEYNFGPEIVNRAW